MKLDAQVLRYLKRDDFRVLTAIEMGMKNHELVPTPLICTIAALSAGPGAAFKIINTLHRNKLIYHENKVYDGYRLTYLGYDYLALRTYVARGLISGLGRRIGVGKEADIYEAVNEAGEMMVLKIHRLGRISFRQIKNKRDYLLHRKNASWMYMSRLAAIREFSFLKALFEHGFPVPTPYDQSRHTILMSFVPATPFGQFKSIRHTGRTYNTLLNLIVRLAEHGLIHADFNEFNLLLSDDEDESVTLIDFPQMVSTSHPDARTFFERDVGCVVRYFRKRFGYEADDYPRWDDYGDPKKHPKRIDLDVELAASGAAGSAAAAFCTSEEQRAFESYITGKTDASAIAAAAASAGGASKSTAGGADDEEDVEPEDGEEDEDDVDEEALAASLEGDEEGEQEASAAPPQLLGEEEAQALRERLQKQEDEEDAADQQARNKRAIAAAAKKPKSASAASAAAAATGEDGEEQEEGEADEEEETEEEAEARHRERMARKDARKSALQSKQRQQAARKADEKARKERERELAANPQLAAQVAAEKAAAAAVAAAAAAQAAPAASASSAALNEDDEVAELAGGGDDAAQQHDDDDDIGDFDDTRSMASHAALSHLSSSLGSGGRGVLNIKLKPTHAGAGAAAGARIKQTNRNKGREMRKVHQTIKEHTY